MGVCLLCGSNSIINRQDSASRTIYNCPRCGVFVVSDVAEHDVFAKINEIAAFLMNRKLSNAKDTVLISYEKSNLDKDYLQLTVNQIAELFPESFSEQMDLALVNLGLLSGFPGDEIRVEDARMSPIFYVRKPGLDALSFMIKSLQRADFADVNFYGGAYFPCGVTVSPKGWQRIDELKKRGTDKKTLFTCPPRPGSENAEHFGNAASKLAKTCGFRVVSIFTERAEPKVTNELIAGVRSAYALVCDLTESLGEAYYAAGLAEGLSKACLLTCHVSAKKTLQIDYHEHPVIFWESREDLNISLLNALRAKA